MGLTKVIADPSNIFAENIKPDCIRYLTNVTIDTAEEFHNCSHLYIRYLIDATAGNNELLSKFCVAMTPTHVSIRTRKMLKTVTISIIRLGIS